MAAATLTSVLQQLRIIAGARAYEERSDPELLKLFLAQREEAAFVALVKRHGPMVLQVCRRIQDNEHDAEDIFQATFLLLARKAGSISEPESLASWLHGVNPENPLPFFFYHRAKKLAAAVLIKGDEPEGFTVRLQPAATVTGRLIDEDNLPLDGRGIVGDILPGQLNLIQSWGILFWGKSDKDGRFRVEGIVPGVKVDAHIDRTSKPLNNSLFGAVVFDQLMLKPGEIRDLCNIHVNDPK